MSRKQFEAWARSKGADDDAIATISSNHGVLSAMWSAWHESRRQVIEWRSPDKPPTSPYSVLVTLEIPPEHEGVEAVRVVHEAYWMNGRWNFDRDPASAELYASWPVLAWTHMPDPFNGDAP